MREWNTLACGRGRSSGAVPEEDGLGSSEESGLCSEPAAGGDRRLCGREKFDADSKAPLIGSDWTRENGRGGI